LPRARLRAQSQGHGVSDCLTPSRGYRFPFVGESSHIPEVLSVAEAAGVLKVSEQSVRSLAAQGKVEARKVGGAWVISRVSAEELAQARGVAAPPRVSKTRGSKAKLNVLSFFSGAMGLDIGLEEAGLQTIMACEMDKWSRATIAANRPDIPLLGDIRNCTASSIREAAGLGPNAEVDVIAGGPPCQAFSTAGNRQSFEDDRGNVFLYFIELAMELQPKYLVLENVRGLLSAPLKHRPHNQRGAGFPPLTQEELPGGALRHIVETIRAHGYSVSFNLYNAANFGAPQTRERVILICARDGDKVPYLMPTHSQDPAFGLPKWKTFKEAVVDLANAEHNHLEFPEDRLRFYRLLGPGEYWKHLPEELQKEALGNSYFSGGGKTGFLRRLAWDRPSPTLVTMPNMPATDLAHPTELRPLSIEEYKRIQVFPDSWALQGPLTQQYKQVGNAVPIPLGAAVGRQIIAHAKGKTLLPPQSFKFSRYNETSDVEFLREEPATMQLAAF
jgi:DNA (cytosine-5)-methyltransferase 1